MCQRRHLAALLSLIIFCANWCFLPRAMGQESPAASQSTPEAATSIQAIDFDLGSTQRTIPAGSHGEFESALITVGATQRAISPVDLVTPAEHLAVHQVISGAGQSLVLAEGGNAVGGSFAITQVVREAARSLVVPAGVTALHDAAAAGQFTLPGNFNNQGSYYALSTNAAHTAATISALNVLNQQGAVLSSVFSTELGALVGQSVFPVNLNLVAVNDVINHGTITSAGSLNISAGGAIINALPPGASGPPPVMQALQDLNLASQAGAIVNSGVIASTLTNVNIATLNNLVLNNLAGRIEALSAINIRDSLFGAKSDTSIDGGQLLAPATTIFSGTGIVRINVDKTFGVLNVHGGEAYIASSDNSLRIGELTLSGDPVITNLAGDIVFTSPVTTGGSQLVALASGSISSDIGAGAIDTSSASGDGGRIVMVAGAAIRSTPGASSPLPFDTGVQISDFTIDGPSVTGGRIDLTGNNPVTSFTTRSTAANGSGGDIALAAYAGLCDCSGEIKLPTNVTIQTGGSGTGSNGDIAMSIQPSLPSLLSPTGTLVETGDIDTRGGTGGGGNVNVTNAVRNNAPGTARVSLGDIYAYGAAIALASAQDLVAGPIDNTGSVGGSAGSVAITVDGSQPFLISPVRPPVDLNGVRGDIIVSPDVAGGNGGSISVTDLGTLGVGISISEAMISASARGSGTGNVLIDATFGPVAISEAVIRADNEAAGNGGSVTIHGLDITVNGPSTISASAGVAGNGGLVRLNEEFGFTGIVLDGAAGAVLIKANGAGDGTGGQIDITTTGTFRTTGGATSLQALGAGSGAGGSVLVSTTYSSFDSFNFQAAFTADASATGTASGGRVEFLGFSAGYVFDAPVSLIANAAGSGNGGLVSLSFLDDGCFCPSASTFNAPVNLQANASGVGNGGTATVVVGGNIPITPTRVNISATGGSPGSAAGNGGVVTVGSFFGDVMFDPAAVQASPLGLSGEGATIISPTVLGFVITDNFQIAGSGLLSVDGAGSGKGGTVDLSANLVSANSPTFSATLSANATGSADGGHVRLNSANGLLGDFNLQANAAGTGSGGFVEIIANNGDLTGTSGALLITATGGSPSSLAGDGGHVSLRGRNVTVNSTAIDARPLGLNGDGATLEFFTSGTLSGAFTINVNSSALNPLDARGVGTGNGGTIVVSSSSTMNLNGGTLAASATGSGSGGSITLDAGVIGSGNRNASLTVASATSLEAEGAGDGAGGNVSIDVRSTGSTRTATMTVSNALSITADGAGNGNAGAVTISVNGTNGPAAVNINAPLTVSASAQGSAGGGSIGFTSTSTSTNTFSATQPFVLNASSMSSGNGGSVTFSMPGGTVSLNLSASLQLIADGALTGNGGTTTLSINQNTSSTLSIASGAVMFSATGGSTAGHGGTVSITAGALNINQSGINAAPLTDGNGPTITINTGSKAITFATGLSADGAGLGSGGAIALTTTAALTLPAGAVLSAAAGTLGGAGGLINISAGVTSSIINAEQLNVAATSGNGGTVVLFGPALGAGMPASTLSVSAAGTGRGGTLSARVTASSLGTNNLTLTADGAGPRGNGGSVALDIASANASANTFSVSASGSGDGNGGTISVTGLIDNTDSYSLTADAAGQGNGGGIVLRSTANIGNISMSSPRISLSAQGGSTGSDSGDGGSITVAAVSMTIDTAIFAAAPRGNNGRGASITLQATGTSALPTLTVNGAINVDGVGTANGGTLVIDGDNVVWNGAGTSVSANAATNGAGGSITLDFRTLSVASPLALSANGAGGGNGGSVIVNANNNAGGSALAIGGTSTVVSSISATGGSSGSATGDGGSVFLNISYQNFSLDMAAVTVAPLGDNGKGGTLDFTLGVNVTLTGPLNVDGVGIGDGGTITLRPLSICSCPLSLGNTGGVISANAGSQGNGGLIDFQFVSLTAPAARSFSAYGAGSGSGGTVMVRTFTTSAIPTTTLTIQNTGPITGVSATGGSTGSLSGDGGTIVLVGGNFNVDLSLLDASPLGQNGKGPTFIFTAGSVIGGTQAGIVTGTLNADGVGNAGGGSITINSGGANSLTVSGTYTADATGSGKGGTIAINAGPSLAVNATLSANAAGDGDGGTVTMFLPNIAVPSPPVGFNGSISVNGAGTGNGGTITVFAQNSTSPVTVSGTMNADAGDNGNGGTIEIKGGISYNLAGELSASGAGSGSGGTINIGTGSGISSTANSLTLSGPLNVNADAGSTGTGGNINLVLIATATAGTPIYTSGGNALSFSALGGSAAGNGGVVSITAAMGSQSNRTLTIDGPLFADAGAPGAGNGGIIRLAATRSTSTTDVTMTFAGSLNLNASAGIDGSGGSIFVGNSIPSGTDRTRTINFNASAALEANGAGSGGGGTVLVGRNPGLLTINVNSTFSAAADGGTGGGGTIRLELGTSAASGGAINLGGTTILSAAATGGTAGTLTVGGSSTVNGTGAINLNGSLSMTANGSGSAAGGNVTLKLNYNSSTNPIQPVNGTGTAVLEASGGTTGNGGRVEVADQNDLTIGAGSGEVAVVASGGSTGSAGGNGGTVVLTSRNGTLRFQPGGLAAGPLGDNGNGANLDYTFTTLVPNGMIDASGVGNGNGGSIVLRPRSSLSLSDALVANAGTSGSGGSISIIQSFGSIALSGAVSANAATSGSGGTLNFSAGTNSITVSGPISVASAGNGSGATVSMSGGSIATGSDIVASGSGNGSGGAISLLASGTLVAGGSLLADAPGSGNAGLITLRYPGGSTFVIGEPPTASGVDGDVSAEASGTGRGGTINISTTTTGPISLAVPGKLSASAQSDLDLGVVSLASTSDVTVDVTGMLAGRLNITNGSGGVAASVQITSTTLVTPGQIKAAGNVTISAPQLALHNNANYLSEVISQSGSVTLNTEVVNNNGLVRADNGILTINSGADLLLSGSGVVRSAEIILNAPTGSITITAAGILGLVTATVGGAFNAVNSSCGLHVASVSSTSGDIEFTAGGVLTVEAGSSISTPGRIVLRGTQGIVIEDNVSIAAGALGSGTVVDFDSPQVLPATSTVDSNGSVLIDNYLDGTAAGNLVIGDNVTIEAFGGAGPAGAQTRSLVGLRSNNSIIIGSGTRIGAWGGDVFINAGQDVSIGTSTRVVAAAKEAPGSPVTLPSGATTTPYVGGGIAVYAGLPSTDLQTLLVDAAATRVEAGLLQLPPGFTAAGNFVTALNGPIVQVIIPGTHNLSVANSQFTADGGTIMIDPPPFTITFQDVFFGAFAPLVLGGGGPPPPPPQPFNRPTVTVGSTSPGEADGGQVAVPISSLGPLRSESTVVQTDKTPTNEPPRAVLVTTSCAPATLLASPQGAEPQTPTPLSGGAPAAPRRAGVPLPGPDGQGIPKVPAPLQWHMVSHQCQVFVLESGSDSTIVGALGSTLAQPRRGVVHLREGKILAMSGRAAVTVVSSFARVKVPENGSVLVEAASNRVLRVANLSGGETRIEVDENGKTESLSTRPGEECVIADALLSEEELIPADGVARQVVGGAIAVAHLKARRHSFDLKSMAAREPLINCKHCVRQTARKLESLREAMTALADGAAPVRTSRADKIGHEDLSYKTTARNLMLAQSADMQAESLNPVSFVTAATGATAGGRAGVETAMTESATVRHLGSAISFGSDGVIDLAGGTALVLSEKKSLLKFGGLVLKLSPGSVVLLDNGQNVPKVRVLWEDSGQSVRVLVGKHRIDLRAGLEVVLQTSSDSPAAALKADEVARRGTRVVPAAEKHQLVLSEVSLVSLMHSSPVLKALASSDDRADKVISAKILKMAACLMHTGARRGPYSRL